MSADGETTTADQPSLRQILEKAGASAVRGGTAGAVAMGMNVGLLMWMRTTVRVMRLRRRNADEEYCDRERLLVVA